MRDDSHWFYRLMQDGPNQYQDSYQFWEHQVYNLMLHGNMYARKSELGGRVRSLMPLAPLQVETKLIDGKVVHLFIYDGDVLAYSADSIWHVRMNSDLLVGRSPLMFGRNLIGVAQAVEQNVTGIYTNGGKPSGVLSFDRLLTAPQRDAIRSSFSTLTTGNDERLLVLELGAKFAPISLSPQDIQLLESRKFQIEEIARWFGVPSILINDTASTTAWGSGIEQLMAGFYKLSLRPVLEAIECSIKTQLFTADERKQYDVEFDFEGLLRSDMKARYEAYRVGINSGILTPNEARAMEWLDALPGGDQLLIQGAMIPIQNAGQQQGVTNGTQDTFA